MFSPANVKHRHPAICRCVDDILLGAGDVGWAADVRSKATKAGGAKSVLRTKRINGFILMDLQWSVYSSYGARVVPMISMIL